MRYWDGLRTRPNAYLIAVLAFTLVLAVACISTGRGSSTRRYLPGSTARGTASRSICRSHRRSPNNGGTCQGDDGGQSWKVDNNGGRLG